MAVIREQGLPPFYFMRMGKTLWLLVAVASAANVCLWFSFREKPRETVRVETVTNTVVRVDTLLLVPPCTPLLALELPDTVRIGDTVVHRQQAVYEDSLYKAYVSGYRPRLDSIEVYPVTRTVTVMNDVYHSVEQRRKRWGFGMQAGYGYPHGAYVGIGVSYNLLSW